MRDDHLEMPSVHVASWAPAKRAILAAVSLLCGWLAGQIYMVAGWIYLTRPFHRSFGIDRIATLQDGCRIVIAIAYILAVLPSILWLCPARRMFSILRGIRQRGGGARALA